MQAGYTVQSFRQTPSRQPTGQLVHDLNVVMVFGPVVTNEQHRLTSPRNAHQPRDSAEETADDLTVKCSPSRTGHVIPAVAHLFTTSGRTVCRQTRRG